MEIYHILGQGCISRCFVGTSSAKRNPILGDDPGERKRQGVLDSSSQQEHGPKSVTHAHVVTGIDAEDLSGQGASNDSGGQLRATCGLLFDVHGSLITAHFDSHLDSGSHCPHPRSGLWHAPHLAAFPVVQVFREMVGANVLVRVGTRCAAPLVSMNHRLSISGKKGTDLQSRSSQVESFSSEDLAGG